MNHGWIFIFRSLPFRSLLVQLGGEMSAKGTEDEGEGEKPSRRPRRRRAGEDEDTAGGGAEDKGQDEDLPVRAVQGGWGMESGAEAKGGPPAAMVVEGKPTESDAPGRRGRRHHCDDDDSDILVIPDLEDEQEEDITVQVAAAPRNAGRRLPGLRELDQDVEYTVPSATEGLDLSILSKTLVPPEMLREDDTAWQFDTLLADVSQGVRGDAQRAAKLATQIAPRK